MLCLDATMCAVPGQIEPTDVCPLQDFRIAGPRCPPPSTAADPDGLKTLKFLATKWHIAFSAMLVLGLLLSTLM